MIERIGADKAHVLALALQDPVLMRRLLTEVDIQVVGRNFVVTPLPTEKSTMQDNPLNGFSDPVVRRDATIFLHLMTSDLGLSRPEFEWSEVGEDEETRAHQLSVNGGQYLVRYRMMGAYYEFHYKDPVSRGYEIFADNADLRTVLHDLLRNLAEDHVDATFDQNFAAHTVGGHL